MAKVSRDQLLEIPLNELLTDEQLETIQAAAGIVALDAGSGLPGAGKAESILYFVQKGSLDVVFTDPTEQRTRQRTVEVGGYAGLYPLLTGLPARTQATATQPTVLITLPADKLHEYLLPGTQSRRLDAGDVLYNQGQPAEFLYFLRKGRVKLERTGTGNDATLGALPRTARKGSYLGRYAMITGEPFQATVRAQESTEVVAIPLRALQPLLFLHEGWRAWFFPVKRAQRLRAVPLFAKLDDWDVYVLADEVQPQEFEADQVIYRQGEPGEGFYVIDRGQVEERPRSGEGPWYLAAGNFFGQDSFKGGWQRNATTIARKKTQVLLIPGGIVKELLQQRGVELDDDAMRGELVARLREVDLFADLPDPTLGRLAGYVNLVFHRPGDIVARQGEPADKLMILHEGEAVVQRKTGREPARPVRRFKVYPEDARSSSESEHFGARSLIGPEIRGATVEITEPSTWIVLERRDFQQFLEDVGLSKSDLVSAPSEAGRRAAGPLAAGELGLPFETRRHWIVAVGKMALPSLLAALFMLWIILAPPSGQASGGVFLVLRLIFFFVFFGWALYTYFDWRVDVFRVTEEAVVHIERELLISEERYEAPLHQIQNVNTSVSLLGQVLRYGDVLIETAAARGRVQFTTVPDPFGVERLIGRAAEEARSGQQVEIRESIRQRLDDRLMPERLDPDVPSSVLVETPEEVAGQKDRQEWFRRLGFLLPPFEEHVDDRIIWRKHWFNLLVRTGLPFLATTLTGIFVLSIVSAYLADLANIPPPSVVGAVSQVWLLIPSLLLLILSVLWLKYQYEEWKNDIYIVTNEGLIDQERELAIFPFWWLYSEIRRAAALSNVQYVDLRIPNPIAQIFGYGDVIIQTAGAEGRLDFLFVRNPRRVHAEILQRLAEFEERQRQEEREQRWRDMAEWFDAYHQVSGRTDTT